MVSKIHGILPFAGVGRVALSARLHNLRFVDSACVLEGLACWPYRPCSSGPSLSHQRAASMLEFSSKAWSGNYTRRRFSDLRGEAVQCRHQLLAGSSKDSIRPMGGFSQE